ncbi:MAG TPA: hypothetical protein VL147_14465 [Devosia sp.]|nr:hypothetical protein [Devosia sp.]
MAQLWRLCAGPPVSLGIIELRRNLVHDDALTEASNGLSRFIADIPMVTLREPLASFPGARTTNIFTHVDTEAVKSRGFSPEGYRNLCFVRRSLALLYGGDIPKRAASRFFCEMGMTRIGRI